MVDLVFKDSEKKHKFHLVNPSPWPIVGAFSALFLVSGAILYTVSYTHLTLPTTPYV